MKAPITEGERWYTLYALRGPCGSYIGCTSRPLQVRLKEHINSARYGSPCPVHAAIREHGESAFCIEQIERFFGSHFNAHKREAALCNAARAAGEVLLNGTPGARHGTLSAARPPRPAAPSVGHMKFAQWVQWLRETESATQADVARRIGVSEAFVSKVLGFHYEFRRITPAINIARASAAWPHGPIRMRDWVTPAQKGVTA